ncbi:hypothetical protein GSI_08377 [Ganoderma sinense ZZ0214-1]|uniref:FAD-binding FR-type domain-containing protein n=1 Tax=Ganoderma sinense ZZ0214-1 TaxID=1077348 RepID=A0A2G8S6R0_9APHY|nr:hypothetical protein GSI_08377 [Ganoderma sinense ZZ0214-1]
MAISTKPSLSHVKELSSPLRPNYHSLSRCRGHLRPIYELRSANMPISKRSQLQDPFLWEDSGYQPSLLCDLRRANFLRLVASDSDHTFWQTFRDFTADKPRPPLVSMEQLHASFQTRMNPPKVLPSIFDPFHHALNQLRAMAMSELQEVDSVKAHIRANCRGTACGLDSIPYDEVLKIPSERLQALFQLCIDDLSVPQAWLTAAIAAVKKPRKDGTDPESYRTIGLESCLLKTLTLLIDRCLREWADSAAKIPLEQTGFRKGHRAINNVFILRALIDKARHLRRPLYVVYLDLSNAYPSVDQPSMWTKLADAGAQGPLIDWLRLLYANLSYVVHHDGETSECFRAFAGILTGDPASPILWILYIADLRVPPHPDDVMLGAIPVSLLLLADDILLASMSPQGIQEKLCCVQAFCDQNFLTINLAKTIACVFGPLPRVLPTLWLHGCPVRYADEATYVGVTLSSTTPDIFQPHYTRKAQAARTLANATLSLESYMGILPPRMLHTLYQARVDPHLTYGCEVMLDVCPSSVAQLEAVQHTVLRRMVGLGPRSQLLPLALETGCWPVRYRRLQLVLRYAQYILRNRPPIAFAALHEAARLAGQGAMSWFSDLHHALQALPSAILFFIPSSGPSSQLFDQLAAALPVSLARHLSDGLLHADRLPFLQWRVRKLSTPLAPATVPPISQLCKWQPYLSLPNTAHRRALLRLLGSEHSLAVEALRRCQPDVPHHRRLLVLLCLTMALQGWHPGERAIQRKLGFDGPMSQAWTWISGDMPEQHRIFHSRNLPFIPLTTVDTGGRPWSSILASKDGKPGFVRSPTDQTLVVECRAWDGDPLVENIGAWLDTETSRRDRFNVAGIGIEFGTRRRNKFAGFLREAASKEGHDFELKLSVNQAIGNCPKYINIRELIPHPDTQPEVVHHVLDKDPSARLPDEIIHFIQAADTVFLSSVYNAKTEDSIRFPSHTGMNQRGGLPGFVQVSQGHVVCLPDFSGNRLMTSLGNIEATPLAGLSIVNFETGDVLYLTGDAWTLVGDDASALMPRQPVLTTIDPTGYIFVRDALPVRQAPGSEVVRSPYSPPVKYLREEVGVSGTVFSQGNQTARITTMELHSDDLATISFELTDASEPLKFNPGQAVALDFSSLLGKPQYQHMAPFAPASINDDRVRTWTISSAGNGLQRSFDLTMRQKPGGVVTGALFAIAHKLAAHRPDFLEDTRVLGIEPTVVGITGEFTLPPAGEVKALWVAGGTGVTPFLSMLRALIARGEDAHADIVLALATREPGVMLRLLKSALSDAPPPGVRVQLDVFTSADVPALEDVVTAYGAGMSAAWHKGRIPATYWAGVADGREVFVCGLGGFGDAAVEGVKKAGVPDGRIHREGFAY